jgi:hypothetical protein
VAELVGRGWRKRDLVELEAAEGWMILQDLRDREKRSG